MLDTLNTTIFFPLFMEILYQDIKKLIMKKELSDIPSIFKTIFMG